MNRFETIANNLAEQIRSGHIPVGTKLPSLRQIISQYGVSQTTVFRAYYLLEQWGLVRAEERAGYFVAPGATLGATPATNNREDSPKKVDISDLVFSVLESTRHPDIVPFGSAFPSPKLFPSARLLKSLVAGTRSLSPWSTVEDLPGSDHLRQQIGLRYIGTGFAVGADEIIVTNGALEALNLCLMAVTRPGDVVAVEAPGFYAALQAIERLDLRAVEIPVDPVTGLDLDALRSSLEQHPIKACWFMPNFQNPTGTSLTMEKKRTLVEMLREKQVPLIEDDVYQELHFSRERPLPAKAFDTAGLVMHCSSFSKTLAPGYRIGWAAAGRFADKVRRLKLMTTLSACIPAQAGLADYLQHGGYDRHLRSLRSSFQAQLEQMEEALRKWLPDDIKWTRPDGGYMLWLQLPQSIRAMELHSRAIERGVSIAPGPLFSLRHSFQNCVRLNFGHPWDARYERAVKIFADILDDPSVHD